MPRVKIEYIVSFSSEDQENQANNLLSWEINKKKWLCKEGEPSCSVVLQLAKAVQIESVNIGVHHAALVEVLVGLSEKPNDPFEVLVPSCVFVSAADSRRSEGVERVRSFSGSQLAPARGRRWDRLRLVCSQPYNKRVKYGLSFVHLYSSESEPSAAPAPALPLLSLDTYSSDEDEFRPGELFAQRLAPAPAAPPASTSTNTDAQIRLASSQALNNIKDSSTKLIKTPIAKNSRPQHDSERQQVDRQRDSIMYTEDDDRPHRRIDRVVRSHNEQRSQEERSRKRSPPDSGDRRAKREKVDGGGKSETDQKDDRSKKDHTKKLNTSDRADRKQIGAGPPSAAASGPALAGVVFSISGYENPRRARIRDAAVALGARYEPSALARCTHLVCAFPNTPKLRELQRVAPTARAVRAEWVEHSAAAARRLPEPPYAPDRPPPPAPAPPPAHTKPASDADTDDEIERALQEQTDRHVRDDSDTECDEPDTPRSGADTTRGATDTRPGRSDTSDKRPGGSDATDIRRSGTDVSDCRGAEPDAEDEPDTETDEPPPHCDEPKSLPALFDGEQVALDPRLPPATRALLARYLRGYGALVLQADELLHDSAVSYYVVSERGDAPGVTAPGDTPGVPAPGAVRVTPRWVWRCHRKQKLCAVKR